MCLGVWLPVVYMSKVSVVQPCSHNLVPKSSPGGHGIYVTLSRILGQLVDILAHVVLRWNINDILEGAEIVCLPSQKITSGITEIFWKKSLSLQMLSSWAEVVVVSHKAGWPLPNRQTSRIFRKRDQEFDKNSGCLNIFRSPDSDWDNWINLGEIIFHSIRFQIFFTFPSITLFSYGLEVPTQGFVSETLGWSAVRQRQQRSTSMNEATRKESQCLGRKDNKIFTSKTSILHLLQSIYMSFSCYNNIMNESGRDPTRYPLQAPQI